MFQNKAKRIEFLETELAKTDEALKHAQDHNRAMEKAFKNCATLIDVEKNGRVLIFKFQRNGSVFIVETYAEMGVDVTAIKKQAGLIKDD